MKKLCIVLFLALAQALGAASLTGLLDPSFNVDLGRGFVWKMAAQADGKIVILGDFETVNGYPRTNMARLTKDGLLDRSFAVHDFVNPLWVIDELIVNSDNKAILAGTITNYGARVIPHILRLNADGSYDSTFHVQENPMDYIFSLVLQPDGKLLVGGSGLVRLLSDGSIDSTFKPVGMPSAVYAIAVQGDGKILVAGTGGVQRLNADGSLDTVFHNASRPLGTVMRIIALPDGRAIVGGLADFKFDRTISSLMRLQSYGSLDPTFVSPIQGQIGLLLLDGKQRILVSGSSQDQYGIFARLEPDGTRDLTFQFETDDQDNRVSDAIVQSDGRMIVDKDMWYLDGITHTNSLARLFETNATSVVYLSDNHLHPFETATNFTITLKRSGNLETALTVAYRTQDDTAHAGVDYVATEGSVVFAPGERAKDIGITLIDHATRRSTPEIIFTVQFTIVSGNGVLHPEKTPAYVHIRDADWLTSVEFEEPAYEINESVRNGAALVRRPNPFGFNGDVLVDFHTEDGTARAGIDYESRSGTITFSGYLNPHGVQDEAGIGISIFPNDTTSEPRTFRIVLSNPRVTRWEGTSYFNAVRVAAQLGDLATTEITIVDDRLKVDPALHVWMTSPPWVSYVLEQSTNFVDWIPVYTNSPTWTPAYRDDRSAPAMFFRAIETR